MISFLSYWKVFYEMFQKGTRFRTWWRSTYLQFGPNSETFLIVFSTLLRADDQALSIVGLLCVQSDVFFATPSKGICKSGYNYKCEGSFTLKLSFHFDLLCTNVQIFITYYLKCNIDFMKNLPSPYNGKILLKITSVIRFVKMAHSND